MTLGLHRDAGMKFIIVTGGVLSGLGKGITASSIGRLLKSRGFSVSAIKIDPYLNCDAGTMNPFQHGEVFVLEDGGEVDLDLGNYERFLDVDLTSAHNITTGKVYKAVIEKERKGEYLGKTVQIIPHITNEILLRIKTVARESKADIMIIELGGTVGDIESMPFLEAARQAIIEVGRENVVVVHTTLIPVLSTVGEQKTKPTQHSVKELRSIGIQPDMIVGRGNRPMDKGTREKIHQFCDVPLEAVVSAPDVSSIYQVPLVLEDQGVTNYLVKRLNLEPRQDDLSSWRDFVNKVMNPAQTVNIAVVGKYVDLKDSYLSHIQAFHHAGAEAGAKVNLMWVEAEDIEKNGADNYLRKAQGVLVPGGFGERGTEGKIQAIQYARQGGIPFLGVCFGFQLAVIEFCRHNLGYADANSTELNPKTEHPVVDILPEQKTVHELGGTMRLGSHLILLKEGSSAHRLYGALEIHERHRHRFEVNPDFIAEIEKKGLLFTGHSEDGRRMEVAELPGHPYFMGCQFHPELKSRPNKPSRLHYGLVRAALDLRLGG
jgi:CTP synthase